MVTDLIDTEIRNLLPTFLFIGGLGPRAGSYLYDIFHQTLETLTPSTPTDLTYPDSVLITFPQKESETFNGNFELDYKQIDDMFQLLQAQKETENKTGIAQATKKLTQKHTSLTGLNHQHLQQVVIVPLCITVSEKIYQRYPHNTLTIKHYIDKNLRKWNKTALLCSKTSAEQEIFGKRNTHIDATNLIANFDMLSQTEPTNLTDSILACTELALMKENEHVINAPKIFVQQLMIDYYNMSQILQNQN